MKEEDIIVNLHQLSTVSLNKPIHRLESFEICSIQSFYFFDDFLEKDSLSYQLQLLKAKDQQIELILKNFDKAIANQSGNPNVDLSDLKLTDNFSYTCITNKKERAESKKHVLTKIIPTDLDLFKKYWLLHFISDCKKIVWNIRDILNKPQPAQEKSINILALYNKTQKEENSLNNQAKELFSSSKPKDQQLKEYYQKILPKSITNIDNLFFWVETMENSFKKELGYLNKENAKLSQLFIKLKKEYLQRLEKIISKVDLVDKKKFLLEYQNCIKTLKLRKEITNQKISNFTKVVLKKVKALSKAHKTELKEKEIKIKKSLYNLNPKSSSLHLPNEKFEYAEIINKINNAFFKFESFANATISEYSHFDFDTAFTLLFKATKKPNNYTYEHCKLINQYWELTAQIRIDYDKCEFKNQEAYNNKDFCNDCEIITSLNWDRIEEFNEFITQDQIDEINKKKSISDIINLNKILHINHKQIDKKQNTKEDLKSIVGIEKFNYIIKLLEDLSITAKGKSTLTPRKKGALRGVVEALRETKIIPNIGLAALCNIVANEIELELKSELDASNTSENYKKDTLSYIKNNPFH